MDGDVVLDGGREGGGHVCGLLQGGLDGVVDLFADGVAEDTGAEELAEGAVGLDFADLGDEAEAGVVVVDLRGELDGDLSVAADQPFGCLLAHDLDAGPTLDVQLNDGEACGIGGGEGGVLDGDAVSAVVVFIELRDEKRGEVALQVGEIAREREMEYPQVAVFGGGDGQDRRGGDGDVLVLDVERDLDRGDLDDGVLRARAERLRLLRPAS